MRSRLLSALEFLPLRVKLGRVVYLSARDDCAQVLENHVAFTTAYGEEQGVFRGLTRERDQSSSEDGSDFTILEESDLTELIPKLVAGVVAEILKANPDGTNWNELSHTVCHEFLVEYIGVEMSAPTMAACQRCLERIFEGGNAAGDDYDELHSVVRQSVDDMRTQGDTGASRVIHRARAGSLSADEAAKLLTAFLVGSFPLIQRALDAGMSALYANKRLLGKVYQASFVGDVSAVRLLIRQLAHVQELSHVRFLTRKAALDHEIPRFWLPSLKIEKGDTVRLLINASGTDGEAMPAALRFDPTRPGQSWLRFGVEPHLCFGAVIAETVLASVFVALFSSHRIERYLTTAGQLELKKLPSDPREYDFTIMGSSPPWALAEEKRWLLDAHGVKQHAQTNILSVGEFLRVVILSRTVFYNQQMFYVAYDRKHQVLLGSEFGGSGESTVHMGDGFQVLHSTLGRPTRLGALSDFSSEPDYADYLKAYGDIRRSYYTWAYFTAFLDGSFSFIRSALLLFSPRDGFRPLSMLGNGLLVLVFALVALLLKLPFTKQRLSDLFRSAVERDQGTIQAGFDILDRMLSDGRRHIFGDTFSAADIHICATLANMIVPPQFQRGGVMPLLEAYPPTYKSRVEAFRTSRAGAYCLRTYQENR